MVGTADGHFPFYEHIADGRLAERTMLEDWLQNIGATGPVERASPAFTDWDGHEDLEFIVGAHNNGLLFLDRVSNAAMPASPIRVLLLWLYGTALDHLIASELSLRDQSHVGCLAELSLRTLAVVHVGCFVEMILWDPSRVVCSVELSLRTLAVVRVGCSVELSLCDPIRVGGSDELSLRTLNTVCFRVRASIQACL